MKSEATRKLEAIREELINRKEDVKARLAAWENVQRVYKKDGKPFATLSKNFTNCSIATSVSSRDNDDKDMTIYYRPGNAFKEDYINLSVTCHNKEDFPEDKSRVRQYYSCQVPFYIMNLDEIEAAIIERREYCKKLITDYDKQIAELDKVFTKFANAIDAALDDLRNEAGTRTSLYYLCVEYMQKKY